MGELEPALAGAILLTVRWFIALRLQPHWSLALGRAWWLVALGIAVGVAASADGAVVLPASPGGWVIALLGEAALGAGLGVLASLPAYALIGGAAASAAALRTAPAPLVRACVSAALVAALGLGLHHPALLVLRDQTAVLPPGRPDAWLPELSGLLPNVVVQLDAMLVVALTLATPVLLTVVMVRSVVAVVGTGPEVAKPFSDAVGPALATLAALVAFAAAWSVYPVGWARAAVAVG